MPIVFVHGVANRDSPEYRVHARERDNFFRSTLLPKAQVFDPYWGGQGVKFNPLMPWIPLPDANPRFDSGPAVGGERGLSRLASENPELAIDTAFTAALTQSAQDSAGQAVVGDTAALGDQQRRLFLAAVDYIEKGTDRDAFAAAGTDADFYDALLAQIEPQSEAQPTMGWLKDSASWLARGVKALVSPITHTASDLTLLVLRRPLTAGVGLFMGDVMVYLRGRDAQGPGSTMERIFKPIIEDLGKALALRSAVDPLIVVGHSLGGVILYDLLSDPAARKAIEERSGGKPLMIDALVTVGSQPGLFADMGLYSVPVGANGKRPPPPVVKHWINVFDYTDLLSFACEPLFDDVTDFKFDSVATLFSAHSSYFLRPHFYARLRVRLKGSGVLS